MNVLRIKPFSGRPADALGAGYDIAISEDQTCLRASSADPPLERSFCFDRVFSPNYPVSAFYDYACRPQVEDVVFGRRSFTVVVLGPPGAGKTYTACAVARRAAAAALGALPPGASLELNCALCGEAGVQPRTVLQQSFPAGAEQAQVEQFLGRAVQDAAPHKTESSALLLRLRQSTSGSVLSVIDGPAWCPAFQQALHKFVTTRSALALRESRILGEVRAQHLGAEAREPGAGARAAGAGRGPGLLTVPEANLQVVHCVDGELGASAARFRELLRHLAFAEALGAGAAPRRGEREAGEALAEGPLQQALRVQRALRERLDEARRQLSLAEGALLEEKRRGSEREAELRRQLLAAQGRLEAALARAFSLEQEAAMLREELARANRGAAERLGGEGGGAGGGAAPGASLAERVQRQRAEEGPAGSAGTLRPEELWAAPGPGGEPSPGPRPSPARPAGPGPGRAPGRLPRCEEQFDDFLARVAHLGLRPARR